MNKYQVKIPYLTTNIGHYESQDVHMDCFRNAGIRNYRWYMSQHLAHNWEISCTHEQLVFLCLSTGAVVQRNLTEEYRVSGLAKLSIDEKEALGIKDII